MAQAYTIVGKWVADILIYCRKFRMGKAEPSTLVEVLRWRAFHQPDRLAFTFLLDGETEEAHLTYAQLDRKARAIAACLQGRNPSLQFQNRLSTIHQSMQKQTYLHIP